MLSDKNWFVCGDPHPNEVDALADIKRDLPDLPNIFAWTNVNFLDDRGLVHEVDLILLCPQGWFLIELKAWRGYVTGNDSRWQLHDRKAVDVANPIPLANHKSKLLKAKLAGKNPNIKARCEAYLLLTDPAGKLGLDSANAARVRFLHRKPNFLSLLEAPPQLNHAELDAIRKTMIQCGFDHNASDHLRRFGPYQLLETLSGGNGWQEWRAQQKDRAVQRLRIYRYDQSPDRDNMSRIVRKAHTVLQRIDHPGFMRPIQLLEVGKDVGLAYDYFPGEIPLDEFVAAGHSNLPLRDRLRLFLALTETLAYAHGKTIYHRSLSPSKVWVIEPDQPSIRPKITDWALAKKDENATFQSQLTTAGLDAFFEDEARLYQAPEWRQENPDPAKLDLFSLGALGFFLFTGLKPAESPAALENLINLNLGLNPASAAPGLPPELDELIYSLTSLFPASRCSLSHTLATLSEICAALPEPGFCEDPTLAQPGELIQKDVKVVKRLGQGASSIAFLVETGKRELVLKLANPIANNQRILDEGQLLSELKHLHVVAYEGTLAIKKHHGILLQYANQGTLAEYLASHIRLKPDLLKRFGQQLLKTLAYLETVSVPHRDLKPENIGLLRHENKPLDLLLFDFSLIGTAVESLNVGTAPYRDPFLGHKDRLTWDVHADRYSAALVLHKCATGRLPTASGASQPNPLNPIEIVPDHFSSNLRAMVGFFQKALAVSTADRFADLRDMAQAWDELFENLQEPQTPEFLTDYTFSDAARAAIKELGILTVNDLLALSPLALQMPGISKEARKEIENTQKVLFKVQKPDAAKKTGLDALWKELNQSPDARILLGDPANPDHPGLACPIDQLWPSESSLILALDPAQRPAIVTSLQRQHDRWSRSPRITQLRDDLVVSLNELGQVTSLPQLLDHLLYNRGSAETGVCRQLTALAVLRAAAETEARASKPRWLQSRVANTLVFALTDKGGLDKETLDQLGLDKSAIDNGALGHKRIDAARALGRVADDIVALPALQPSSAALSRLRNLSPLIALPDPILLDLACACAQSAKRSSANELYPHDFSAEQALAYLRPNLYHHRIKDADLRKRITGRFPGVVLPAELFTWLKANGFPRARYEDNDSDGLIYDLDPGAGSTLSSSHSHHADRVSQLSVEAFEKRLDHERAARGFLVLTCPDAFHSDALAALKRRPLKALDGDVLVLDALQALAQAQNIPWDVILQADALSGPDWDQLCQVAQQLRPELERRLARTDQPVLLYHLGLFVRYGLVSLLEQLRQRCGRRDGLAGLWLLMPDSHSDLSPKLDHHLIPILSPNEWARVPDAWLRRAAYPEVNP